MQTRPHVEDNTIQHSKSHIDRLRERRSTITDNTTTVANMISQQMHQLFHDPKCFIYEIIQNAEDAEADSITFKIENEDLVISYNGKPFQEHDIERVCDASRDNDPDVRAKSNQSDKIGYKGIGFKSVFGISSEITILSPKTGYFFQFSKSYWDAKTTEITQDDRTFFIRYPWQIIPLWLEAENYQATASSIDNFEEKITIILRNVDCAKIIPELMAFAMLDERLVFLNRIKKIEFFNAGDYFNIQKTQDELFCKISHSQRNAFRKHDYKTLWHLHRAAVLVEEDITEKLAHLDLSSCPEKIKSAKNTEITFASRIEISETGEYKFLAPRDNKLYCYLPTSIDCHLPFLINARFILNQDRSMIINNTWNGFIIKSIAIHHLKWLGELALNPSYRTNILTLFSTKRANKIFPQFQRRLFQNSVSEDHAHISLLYAYEEGVSEAQKTIAFIPAKDGGLLRLNEYRIDTTSFFLDIDEGLLDQNLVMQGRSKLVAYDLQNSDALITSESEYSFNNLLENIETYFRLLNSDAVHIEIRSKMIAFIFKSDNSLAFFDKRIILCTNRRLHSPNDSFILPATSHFTSESLTIFQINLVDLSLYNQKCEKRLSKALDQVTEILLIKKQIRKMIQEDRINEDNSIAILRFIYTACLSNNGIFSTLQEVEQEYGCMSSFKVITRDGQLRELKQCFLPLSNEDEKNHISHQLSPAYFLKEDNRSIWINLLTGANIITSTELTVRSISYAELAQHFKNAHQRENVILEYAKHILDQTPNSSMVPVVRKEFKERLVFTNFIYFPFMFDLHDPNTLSLFLHKLNPSHKIFSQTPIITGTKHGAQIDPVEICEHFLTYYFKSNIFIKVKGYPQRSKIPSELFYLPELLEHFEPTNLPIDLAELPVELSSAAAHFLGFKLSITLKEGLKLLSTINKELSRKKIIDSLDFERLRAIYRLIIKIDLTREDVSVVSPWKSKHKLLSQARTLEPAENLKIFDQSLDDGLSCPDTAHWLHDVGLSNSELQALAKILGITCYSEDEDFIVNVSNVQNETLSAENLKKFVLSLLPSLTLIEHKEYGVSIEQFHGRIFEYINALVFEYCSDITFNNGYKPSNFARIRDGHLYFTGRLMHMKVYEVIKNKLQSKRAQEWLSEMMSFFPSEQKKAAQIREKIQPISLLNPSVYDQLCLYQVSKVAQSNPQSESGATMPKAVEEQRSTSLHGNPKEKSFVSPIQTVTGSAKEKDTAVDRRFSRVRSTLFDFNPDSPVTKDPHHIDQERPLRTLGNKAVDIENSVIAHSSSACDLTEDDIADREVINKNIGDRGEEFVFRKIVHLLKKQWGIEPCDVIINDPELGQGINACRFVNASGMQLDLIWYNRGRTDLQTMESPVDMVIAVNGEKRYFIEIKSTASKSYSTFFLTANEWDYMREKREKSILVRAYNVNEVTARFEVYQDPFAMIFKNLISFMGEGKFMLKIKSAEEAKEHIFEEDVGLGCKIS